MSAAPARGPLVAMTCLVLAAGGLSCAPPPPGRPEAFESLARHAAEQRARRFANFEARGALRIDGRATGRLPAVHLRVRAAQPDRVRLQVGWLLGVLGDAVLRADSLTVWMPGERLGIALAGVGDTLGVREPARFLARALVAGWVAPHEAWSSAVLDSAGAALEWSDAGERWGLRIDPLGRPSEVSVARGDRIVRARYDRWHGRGAGAWPARLELADGEGWVRLRLDLEDVRALKRARAAWFVVEVPEAAQRMDLEDVKRILSTARGL